MLFRVGLMVLITLIIAAVSWSCSAISPNGSTGNTPCRSTFQQAPGVSADTPVRKNGIRIGYVKNVEMNDENDEVDRHRLDPR